MEVLYLGPGRQPFLSALQAIEGVEIYQADALPEDTSRFGLVVIDRVAVARAPGTNTLWIGDARVAGTPEPTAMEQPDPDAWDARHPLARDIDWAALRIGAASELPVLPLAETLLSSQGAPLIVARSLPEGREVRLAFDPADSNWPEQHGFALFADGLIDWLGLQPGRLPRPACEVGAPCPLDARLVGSVLVPVDPADLAPIALADPVGFRPEVAGLFRLPVEPARFLAVNAASGFLDVGAAAPAGTLPSVLPRGLVALAPHARRGLPCR